MDVTIIMGSKSDLKVGEKAKKILLELKIDTLMTVASAHRTPERVAKLVSESDAKVFIAIAGLSAALPGVVASLTHRPVIGVPVSGALGFDSILSIVQMPPGIPVASVGLDRGDNAALLAAQILALSRPELEQRLEDYKSRLRKKVEDDAAEVEAGSG